MKKKTDNILTELSVALADLHKLGYQEGYNQKAIEINKHYMNDNNYLMRDEATTLYLQAMKMKPTYEKKSEEIIRRITNLIFDGIGDEKYE